MSKSASGSEATLAKPTAALVGLDAGKATFARRRRRQRIGNQVRTGFALVLALVVVGAGAYVGYEVYQQSQDKRDAEVEPSGFEPITVDADRARQISEAPRWNGPGVPAIGLDDEP